MARTEYTVRFPAARPGDDVTWPNTVHVYPDANTPVPLQSGQSLDESLAFSGWSDATSVVFTRPAGDNDTVTVTSGSPSGTGAAVPAPSGGSSSLPVVQLTSTSGWVIGTSQPSAWLDAGSAGGTALTPDAAAGTITVNENGFYLVLARLSAVVCTAAGYLTLDDTNGRFLVDRSLPISTFGATLSISDLVFQTAGTVMALEVYTGDGALAGHGGNIDFYVTQTAKSAI